MIRSFGLMMILLVGSLYSMERQDAAQEITKSMHNKDTYALAELLLKKTKCPETLEQIMESTQVNMGYHYSIHYYLEDDHKTISALAIYAYEKKDNSGKDTFNVSYIPAKIAKINKSKMAKL